MRKRFAGVALLCSLSAPRVSAQATIVPDSGAHATYLRDALWIDGNSVRQGANGIRVARPRTFRPANILAIVEGDSARFYGQRYVHQTNQGNFWLGIGLGLDVAGLIVTNSNRHVGPFGTYNSDMTAPVMLLSGSVIAAVIGSIRLDAAQKSLSKAVYWHNARFAR